MIPAREAVLDNYRKPTRGVLISWSHGIHHALESPFSSEWNTGDL